MSKRSDITWTTLGWQGIHCEIPEDWSLSVIQGDGRAGYVRLDDEDMVRMELRWQEQRRGERVDSIADRYLKTLAQESKKRRVEYTVKRGIKLVDLEGRDFEYVFWEGDFRAFNLISVCKTCKRAVLVRILFRKGEKMKPIAKRVFGSITDHSNDGNCRWNVYGFRFVTPEPFLLDEHSLKTGCLEMRFYDRRDEMEAVRVSLAEVILKNESMEAWFRKFYRKRLKGFECKITHVEDDRHPEMLCHGRVPLKKRLHKVFQKPRYIHCRVWRCLNSEKIFLFRVTSTNEKDENFEGYSKLVRCCESMESVNA